MGSFHERHRTKNEGDNSPYELIQNPGDSNNKDMEDSLFPGLPLSQLKDYSVPDSHVDQQLLAHYPEILLDSIQNNIFRPNSSSSNRPEFSTKNADYNRDVFFKLEAFLIFVFNTLHYISGRFPVIYRRQSSNEFSTIRPSTTLLSTYNDHNLTQVPRDPYHFNSLSTSSNLTEQYKSSNSPILQQISSAEFNLQHNDVRIAHSIHIPNSFSFLKSKVSSYFRSMDSTNKPLYQFSGINLCFDSLKTLVSGKNTLFNKIEDIIKMNKKVGINIELIYIFKAYLEEFEVILVTNEDQIYCYGHNWNGVLGFGHNNSIEEFTINEELSNQRIIEFRNSECHTIARNIDGKFFCFGNNWWGCLGNGTEDRKIHKPEINTYLNNEIIIDMCCGYRHTLVLTSNNEVYAWGDNDKGQIGNRHIGEVVSIPFKVEEFNREKVVTISSGFNHSMALTQLGNVFSWGCNENGQLGLSNGIKNENKPKRIQIDVEIQKICCGQNHSLLLSHDGDIYVFGRNRDKQLGIKTFGEKQFTPVKLNHSEKFNEIASHCQYNISAAHSKDGLYYIWGKCGRDGIISEPKETQFKSFDEIFAICI